MRVFNMGCVYTSATRGYKKKMRYVALFLLPVLSACALPGPMVTATPGPANLQDRITLECRMLERASTEISAGGQVPPSDILVGCPGHEDLRDTMSMAEMSAATRRANAARAPDGVRALGPRADQVFRRMITRGVPVAVAEAMTGTPEFTAAVR
ncbi:MAG: hypothetical protein JJU15_19840 [Pararhodobacter sp.]|nr:hypothetical protein [Pararhodobacter sp.]